MQTKLWLFIGLAVLALGTGVFAVEADLILYNGKVISADPGNRIFQAFAVNGDKILALGTTAEIQAIAGAGTTKIGLKGKTVTPGLIDLHYQMMYYGAPFWPGYLNIRHSVVTNKAQFMQVIGDMARTLAPGEEKCFEAGYPSVQDVIAGSWKDIMIFFNIFTFSYAFNAFENPRPIQIDGF